MNVGLLGGCFNPVHVGHLRLAIEAAEALGLDRVELVPAARPPHKPGEGMLPFELRAALCEAAVDGVAALGVNRIEAALPGPSYTVETLRTLRERRPGDRFTFLLGAGDLRAMPGWHQGLEIPALADLGVAGRGPDGLERVRAMVECAWPGVRPEGDAAWSLPGGGRVSWCGVRRLDVSSSDVRERWLAGRSVRALVPECVERMLAAEAAAVRSAWEE
jgi:nicotinate-nucleotide adenylyltransferase